MVDSLRRIMCSCGNVDVSLLVFHKVKGSDSVGAEAIRPKLWRVSNSS